MPSTGAQVTTTAISCSASFQAIWFRDQPGEAGNVFGVSDKWTGMGLILDSYDNDGGVRERWKSWKLWTCHIE